MNEDECWWNVREKLMLLFEKILPQYYPLDHKTRSLYYPMDNKL